MFNSFFGVYQSEHELLIVLAYIGAAFFVFVFPGFLGFVIWHQIDQRRPYARTVMVPDGEPDSVPPRTSPLRRFRRLLGGAR